MFIMRIIKAIVRFKWLQTLNLYSIILYVMFLFIVLSITFSTKLKHKTVQNEHGSETFKSPFNKIENNLMQSVDLMKVKHKTNPNELKLLKEAFYLADLSRDKKLTIKELAIYINGQVRHHIDTGIKQNPVLFAEIDISPRDGLVTWDEYFTYFLKKYDIPKEQVLDAKEGVDYKKLKRKVKEELVHDKAVWDESARNNFYSLTLDEFLAFRHPEASVANLLNVVEEMLIRFDSNGDDTISKDEFCDISMADLNDETMRKSVISTTIKERKAEFDHLLDRNHDGKASRVEILNFIDPKHPRYALQEAAELFKISDTNHDTLLTLEEVLNSATDFLESKMINTRKHFHDY